MMQKVFIQTNNKQLLGAKLAKFALEKYRRNPASFTVEIMNVDEMPLFKKYSGIELKRGKSTRDLDADDLQFFTLSRFLPPSLMQYQGLAVVIDPDIFARTDVSELFSFPLAEHAIAARRKENRADKGWESSVMLLDCAKLHHWNVEKFIQELSKGAREYNELTRLMQEDVVELPIVWNHIDTLTPETKMLHTSHRLTQPWKTGLPIDFTRNDPGKAFGFWPRIWDLKLRGKWPSRYQPHPEKDIENFFIKLTRDALKSHAIDRAFISEEIADRNVRSDIFRLLDEESVSSPAQAV